MTTEDNKKSKNIQRPEKMIRSGAVAASIWKRMAPSGFCYYDFSLSRAWKSQSGRDGYSNNFFSENEAALNEVIREAASWIASQQVDQLALHGELMNAA